MEQVFGSSRISFIRVSERLIEDYLLMVNDQEKVNRYFGGEAQTYTAEQERAWVRETLEKDAWVFSMIEKESGEFIGNIELMDGKDAVGELGIAITGAKQGLGYGTEAVRAITGYGLRQLGLKGIVLRTDPRNSRAIHVYQKCGFKEYDRTDAHVHMRYLP